MTLRWLHTCIYGLVNGLCRGGTNTPMFHQKQLSGIIVGRYVANVVKLRSIRGSAEVVWTVIDYRAYGPVIGYSWTREKGLRGQILSDIRVMA